MPETRAIHWRIVDKVSGAAWAHGAYFREQAKAEKRCEELKAKHDKQDLVVQMVTSPVTQGRV